MIELVLTFVLGASIALLGVYLGFKMGRLTSGNIESLFDKADVKGKGRVLDAFPFPAKPQQGAEGPEYPETWETP